jgi:hypothetical protein
LIGPKEQLTGRHVFAYESSTPADVPIEGIFNHPDIVVNYELQLRSL